MKNKINTSIRSGILLICALFHLAPAQAQFRPATPDYALHFPRDHGAHPDNRIEWWYFTGRLRSSEGQEFGFQWTVFRRGLTPPGQMPDKPSPWRSPDLFAAHLAISDLKQKKFYHCGNLSRSSLGLAGASLEKLLVWLPGFRAEAEGAQASLQAQCPGLKLRLDFPFDAPAVLHGQGGYSPKAAQPGYASHYYSLPRLPVRGSLEFDSKKHAVQGLAWMDHEFGLSELAPGQVGWDWFGLRLDSGAALMLFRVRGESEFRSGTYVDVQGRAQALKPEDIELKPLDFWQSPATGGRYPLRWSLKVKPLDLSAELRAVFPEQELGRASGTGIVYWEGAVDLEGTMASEPLRGEGYLEMTGYAEKLELP